MKLRKKKGRGKVAERLRRVTLEKIVDFGHLAGGHYY